MKPFLSSTAPLRGPRPRVKAIRPVSSACEPPESCPTITTIRPRGGGISHRRCHAAGSSRQEEPDLRCCSAPHPGSPGACRNSSSAPSNTCPQPTLNSQPPTLRPRPALASPVQSIATPSGEGGAAATAAAPATASCRAAPRHTSGPANRSGTPIGWRPSAPARAKVGGVRGRGAAGDAAGRVASSFKALTEGDVSIDLLPEKKWHLG
jgi:hypothetical protein